MCISYSFKNGYIRTGIHHIDVPVNYIAFLHNTNYFPVTYPFLYVLAISFTSSSNNVIMYFIYLFILRFCFQIQSIILEMNEKNLLHK